MRSISRCLLLGMVAWSLVSCKKDKRPNYQYFPNMYAPVGYEAYGEYGVFEGGHEAQLPVIGTVPRGWMPYPYANSNDGYTRAKDSLRNPLPYTEVNVAKGKALYGVYCAICHGAKGNGKGPLVQREKILGVPSYDDVGRMITEGSIYHVMFYGINSMGSYAAQTNEKERWQIAHYVEQLKAGLEGKAAKSYTKGEEPIAESRNSHGEASTVVGDQVH